MNAQSLFVVFRLDGQRYALPLASVDRFVLAVEITALPNAPGIVLGIINLTGRIIPVLSIRQRFRLAERDLNPSDQFLIASTTRHTVALVVDEALGVVEFQGAEMIGADNIVPGVEHIQGVAKQRDGLVLIHDIERFLSTSEARVLDLALSQEVSGGT